MTCTLLFSKSLTNLRMFELDASCPCLAVDAFDDTTSVDTFFTNQAPSLFTPLITNVGTLDVFPSKELLDYFDQHLTLLYPTIKHIDVLDKDTSKLKPTTVEIGANEIGIGKQTIDTTTNDEGTLMPLQDSIEKKEIENNKPEKINFSSFRENKKYFSTDLNTLFQYTPLVFPSKANCTNLMLIDETVDQAHVFYDSANVDTLPVIFNRYTLRVELLDLIKNNTTLNRVCIVATNANMYNNRKLFINDEPYFTLADLSSTNGYSKNMQLLIDLINQHSIKTIDFLACESLTYTAWQQYYTILQGPGCTIGASSDKTGNIAYGGDWIMESDNQNIQPVYFTSDIANYQTTLDSGNIYNIVFGTYTPSYGDGTINVEGTTFDMNNSGTSYNFNQSTLSIWNATNEQVTIRLASITDTYYYNVEINSVNSSAGNGSNVIIDGSGKTFQPGSDAVTFITTTVSANGFITLADTNNALLGIEINNISFNLVTNSAPNIYTADNVGWICGGNTAQANTVSFSECHVSGEEFTIGYDTVNTYNACGGICGGLNGSNGSANGGTYSFNNCSLTSSTAIAIGGGDGLCNGGICGGRNGNGFGSGSVTTNGGTYTFTSCSLTSATVITIGGGYSNGGICGGINGSGFGDGSGSESVITNGGTYIFTNCSLESATDIAIGGGGYYNGGICGGGNGYGYGDGSESVTTNGGTYTFTSCSLTSSTGDITIGGDNYNGGICGGLNGYGYGSGSVTTDGGKYTFTNCSLTSATDITIGGGGYYNGGICGGDNGYGTGSGSVTTNGGNYTFTNCSLTSATDITIGGGGDNYNGGICGGGNGYGSGSGSGSATVTTGGGEYTFTNCSLTSATGGITIGGGGGTYNGGICGGRNGTIDGTTGKTYTFAQCTIIASTSITISGTVVYTATTFNYVSSVASTQTNPTTIAPSTDGFNNALIFPTTGATPTYTTPSLLIVAASMTTIFTQAYINTFAGYNLSGVNLTGVNLSNYNLTNTILTGAILTGVIYNALTKITDSVAIATNIVNNSGTAISLGMYMPSASAMITYGMGALQYGLNSAGQQTQGMSLFVSGLFTALINSKTLGFTSTTEVTVPTSVLPTIITWATAPTSPSTVQLLNASIYPNTYNLPTYSQVKSFDLSSLRSNPVYFYVLVQNFPDTVTITNGVANTFNITAIEPYNVNPALVSFTCQIGTGSPFTVQAGSPNPIVFAGRNFYIGSASSTTAPTIISNICFPSKTPIQTDQGIVSIYKLNTAYHTINGQPILHVTQTMTLDPYLICFEKDAIERNYPNKLTVMTKDHLVMFREQLVPAYRFLGMSNKVKKVKYSGEVLYNVLLAEHTTMRVNNLICETLHPNNAIAKLYLSNFSEAYKRNVVVVMNDALQNRDLPKYKSIINNLF